MTGYSYEALATLVLVLGGHSIAVPTPTSTSKFPQYTIPSNANDGQNIIPNINDPQAVNAQNVCPGYIAHDVQYTKSRLTASLKLAGLACNAYGTDIQNLKLTVRYQAPDRVNIEITPASIQPAQSSWYLLPENLVPKPKGEERMCLDSSELVVTWSNQPTFGFKVTRKATGDILFNTEGTKLVFENQFIEFITELPEDYNLYGLGERIQSLRLPNNATLTTYAADIGDPFDR